MEPIPGIDGGPILKWSLVANGRTSEQADAVVRRANGPLAALLAGSAILSFKFGRRLLGVLLALLGASALFASAGCENSSS